MTKYLFISDNGDAYVVEPDGTSLSTLQRLVDGFVDVVACNGGVACNRGYATTRGMDCWVNDEGLSRSDFGLNFVASLLSGRQLVGPAVITRSDNDGNTIGLTDEDLRRLTERDGLLLVEGGEVYTVDEVIAFEREWREAM